MVTVPLTNYAVHLRPMDNIAVAAKLVPGEVELTFDGGTFTVPATIKMGHKFAVRAIKEGDPIYKFGQIIGFASQQVPIGGHVHVHNVKVTKFERDYAYGADLPAPMPVPDEYRTFMGYDRGPTRPEHQRYGTRNMIAIISTVNCSASTSKYIAERIRAMGVLKDFPNVDGVVPIVHKQGCGHQYEGPDHKQLERTLMTAVDSLPPRQRDAFVLVHMHGHSGGEAAARLGVSLGNLWIILHRTRKLLQSQLQGKYA